MFVAARQLLEDFLSTIIFLAAYLVTGSITIAVGVAIATALLQFAILKLRSRPLDAMQWTSLGLVVVLGGIALVTADPRFILVKPGLIHIAIGAAMLRRGWMIRYLPPIVPERLGEGTVVAAGYAWSGLMVAIGIAIIVVAILFDFAVWAWFVSVGVMGLQIGAFLLQYIVFRMMIRRRRRAVAAASG